MKAKDFLNAMQVMDEFTGLVSCVYPDKYKIVCMKHGIDERDAMDMYSYLQKMKSGELVISQKIILNVYWLWQMRHIAFIRRIA